jgi:hypothetical protein
MTETTLLRIENATINWLQIVTTDYYPANRDLIIRTVDGRVLKYEGDIAERAWDALKDMSQEIASPPQGDIPSETGRAHLASRLHIASEPADDDAS